jgi:leucyl-tRNA synthetase
MLNRAKVIIEGGITPTVYTGEGTLVHSDTYDGMASSDARETIVADLEGSKKATEQVNYKIRDWLISRQRYWGAPIPVVHCPVDGAVAVPKEQLPIKLPVLEKFQPSGDGQSPLALATDWVNTTCPTCGGPAKRETDTMDGFACSSWYFLRFADPKNATEPFAKDKVEYWAPVDMYVGGAEHAVMHLLYARMWTKVMQDAGMISFSEPFKALRNQGMLLAADGQKISKSKGNDIKPEEIIEQGYGADSLRMIVLFLAPFDMSTPWSNEGLAGVFRFLQRVWTISQNFITSDTPHNSEAEGELYAATHRAIKKVSHDIEHMAYNTAISALMQLTNELYVIEKKYGFAAREAWQFALETLTQLLAPFAPHITEELWVDLSQKGSVHISNWPIHDEAYLVEHVLKIAVQVNGKLRGEIEVAHDAPQEVIVAEAQAHENVAQYLSDGIKKTIYVPNKIVNFVV